MAEPLEYLTVAEVAARLRVTTRTVLGNVKRGIIPALRLNRAYRIPVAYLEALTMRAQPAPLAPADNALALLNLIHQGEAKAKATSKRKAKAKPRKARR